MAYNIEIKARYFDSFKKAHIIAQHLSSKYVGLDKQIDTYFKTINSGRFKLRESLISGAYLVPYIRPDQLSAKKSSYVSIKVENNDIAQVKELFSKLYGVEAIVEKVRDIYYYDNVRIHLDEVNGLGRFFELEAEYKNDLSENHNSKDEKIEFLMKEFGISKENLLCQSYKEMISKKIL